jgi:hypothetical protein
VARPGASWEDSRRVHAVARLLLAGAIDNVQLSWVKLGLERAVSLLQGGCNDLGGTLMEETISRAGPPPSAPPPTTTSPPTASATASPPPRTPRDGAVSTSRSGRGSMHRVVCGASVQRSGPAAPRRARCTEARPLHRGAPVAPRRVRFTDARPSHRGAPAAPRRARCTEARPLHRRRPFHRGAPGSGPPVPVRRRAPRASGTFRRTRRGAPRRRRSGPVRIALDGRGSVRPGRGASAHLRCPLHPEGPGARRGRDRHGREHNVDNKLDRTYTTCHASPVAPADRRPRWPP